MAKVRGDGFVGGVILDVLCCTCWVSFRAVIVSMEGSTDAVVGVLDVVEQATGGDESVLVTGEVPVVELDDSAVEGQAESTIALAVAVDDTTGKWGTGCWMVLDAEVEQGTVTNTGGGGGVVQAGLAGDEWEAFEHWSGVCVSEVAGGGEEQ